MIPILDGLTATPSWGLMITVPDYHKIIQDKRFIYYQNASLFVNMIIEGAFSRVPSEFRGGKRNPLIMFKSVGMVHCVRDFSAIYRQVEKRTLVAFGAARGG